MIRILPLEKKFLVQAIELAEKIFPEEEIISKAFLASVDENKFKEFQNLDQKVRSLEYFFAIDKNENVCGISGLYSLQEDFDDSYWLGWYCVDPKNTGKGIGKALLDYCVEESKRRGKKYLKVRTSRNPLEERAQEIYERNGFHIYDDDGIYISEQKKEKDSGFEKIFRRKVL